MPETRRNAYNAAFKLIDLAFEKVVYIICEKNYYKKFSGCLINRCAQQTKIHSN